MFTGGRPTVNQARPGKSTIARVLGALGSALAPPQCVLCDQLGLPGPIDLCGACLADLPRPARDDSFLADAFELVCCPWSFDFPVDALVRTLKFRGERAHARILGTLLARERWRDAAPLPHRVVPVPLHPSRLRQRGFNQAAELARFAARELALPLEQRALCRPRATREQTALGSVERAANVHHAFAATGPLHDARVALVDDVVTTGSTVRAAAAALRAAGAGAIELWVAARVPLRRESSFGTGSVRHE